MASKKDSVFRKLFTGESENRPTFDQLTKEQQKEYKKRRRRKQKEKQRARESMSARVVGRGVTRREALRLTEVFKRSEYSDFLQRIKDRNRIVQQRIHQELQDRKKSRPYVRKSLNAIVGAMPRVPFTIYEDEIERPLPDQTAFETPQKKPASLVLPDQSAFTPSSDPEPDEGTNPYETP